MTPEVIYIFLAWTTLTWMAGYLFGYAAGLKRIGK